MVNVLEMLEQVVPCLDVDGTRDTNGNDKCSAPRRHEAEESLDALEDKGSVGSFCANGPGTRYLCTYMYFPSDLWANREGFIASRSDLESDKDP